MAKKKKKPFFASPFMSPKRDDGGNHPGRSHKLPRRVLSDGFSHGLEPVVPLDLDRVSSVDDLVRGMGKTAFTARQVGEAADILYDMVTDPECLVVCTVSGAMTVAKMGLVLCEMIDRGWVQVIVSTGALMTHGLVESGGKTHFKWNPHLSDESLFAAGYDRVYDTLELEKNLDDVEFLLEQVLEPHNPKKPLSSWEVCRLLGQELVRKVKGRGILKSAFKKNVPVYIPAFIDSELGLDFALINRRRKMEKKAPYFFDAIADLEHFANLIEPQKKLGIFTIGGGVPRNWAQQIGPYLDLVHSRLGTGVEQYHPYDYGVRICPDPPHWGHLSGCTYSEGVSWGKFVPKERGGRWAEVLMDATVAWPMIVKAVCERLDKQKDSEKKSRSLRRAKRKLLVGSSKSS